MGTSSATAPTARPIVPAPHGAAAGNNGPHGSRFSQSRTRDFSRPVLQPHVDDRGFVSFIPRPITGMSRSPRHRIVSYALILALLAAATVLLLHAGAYATARVVP